MRNKKEESWSKNKQQIFKYRRVLENNALFTLPCKEITLLLKHFSNKTFIICSVLGILIISLFSFLGV